jgi:hypothetical protein
MMDRYRSVDKNLSYSQRRFTELNEEDLQFLLDILLRISRLDQELNLAGQGSTITLVRLSGTNRKKIGQVNIARHLSDWTIYKESSNYQKINMNSKYLTNLGFNSSRSSSSIHSLIN